MAFIPPDRPDSGAPAPATRDVCDPGALCPGRPDAPIISLRPRNQPPEAKPEKPAPQIRAKPPAFPLHPAAIWEIKLGRRRR
ncbi:MAG: hypothetical protein AB7G80_01445 [Dongiaceae bacterium]